jgi:HAD superfamily hydrolase (TIGR01484 family)
MKRALLDSEEWLQRSIDTRVDFDSVITKSTAERPLMLRLKVEAIFSDYDGTLCPLEVPRAEAFIAPRLRKVLSQVSARVPFCIITTKDMAFIKERVPFARGIAAVSGLEIQVGKKTLDDPRIRKPSKTLGRVYQEVLSTILQTHGDIAVERKTTERGDLVAFCIDWRLAKNWAEARKEVVPLLKLCREAGLHVVESEISPFVNVFPMKVEKGEALLKLKGELDVSGPVMYLGDSEFDDSAFKLAEVSVGVKHTRSMPKLACKYRLEFMELERFFSDLIYAEFNFGEDMAEKNLP